MKIAKDSVMNFSTAVPGLVAAFDLGEGIERVCPIVGWATLVQSHTADGSANTCVAPAFLWGEMVWTEAELGEHSPGLVGFRVRPAQLPEPGRATPQTNATAAVLGHRSVDETSAYASDGVLRQRLDKLSRAVNRADSLADQWANDKTPITRSEAAEMLSAVLVLDGWTQTDAPPAAALSAVPTSPKGNR